MQRRLSGALAIALACLAPGCGSEERNASSGAPVEVEVYAATSTRDVLQALETLYEREHAADLVLNFGSSGDLTNQIIAAAKANVFLSADEKDMDRVAGLVVPGTRAPLLSNQLVVVEPAGDPSLFHAPFEPGELAGDGVELLSLADVETVPAGRYAKAWLEERGVWKRVSARVLPGIDVRAALAAVESGAAQAGIVYRTDAARSTKVRVVHAVPLEEGPKISYPVAVLQGRRHESEARDFVAFLRSPAAQAVFEEAGFVFLPAAGASSE